MTLRAMRFLGALAILAVGAIHLQQYIGANYRAIPTIGTLFLLNAIASAVVGMGLLAPSKRAASAHRADLTIGLLALAAVAIAVGALAGLFISESAGLFGFTESGYRAPIVVAMIAEASTIALFGPVATVTLVGAFRRPRETTTRRRSRSGSQLDYGAAR